MGQDKHQQRADVGEKPHLVHGDDDAVDDLPLERLPHHRPVLHFELGFALGGDDPPPADVDVHTVEHAHDVAELARARPLDVRQELVAQVLVHLGPEEQRVQRQVERQVLEEKHGDRGGYKLGDSMVKNARAVGNGGDRTEVYGWNKEVKG